MAESGTRVKPTKINDLKIYSRSVETIVKVVSKTETRKAFLRDDRAVHRVCYALVGDETGSIYLTLWNDAADKVKAGQVLKITNGYVSLHEGSMRLNIGRYGSFEVLSSAPFKEVNLENNLSSRVYEQREI